MDFQKNYLNQLQKLTQNDKEPEWRVRVTYSLKYHGKLYCFIKNNQIFSTILGSPNLSFLTDEDQTRLKQYEIAFFTNDSQLLENSLKHINQLESKDISENIAVLDKRQLFSDKNIWLRKKKIFKIDWT